LGGIFPFKNSGIKLIFEWSLILTHLFLIVPISLNKFLGVEIATPSISSPNTIDTFGSITDDIDNDFVKSNKNLKYTNGSGKGFVQLTIHSSHIDTKFVYVSTVKSKDYKVIDNNTFTINHNKPL